MLLVDRNGLPLAVNVHSASPNEQKLVEDLVDRRVLRRPVKRLLYDKALDSDVCRNRLKQRGIDLICRHRRNRSRTPLQDGRKLRRLQKRWRIERTIAWLQNFRRLVTRYERHANLYLGLVQLTCVIIVMRWF
jgi:transposase